MDADLLLELDMKKQNVYDPLISKRQQYLLATQLVRAVLKIGIVHLLYSCFFIWLTRYPFLRVDDVIVAGDADAE